MQLSGDAGQKEKYALRAVALLKEALARGLDKPELLHQSGELKPLRQRQDFQLLLKDHPLKK